MSRLVKFLVDNEIYSTLEKKAEREGFSGVNALSKVEMTRIAREYVRNRSDI